MGHLYSRFGEPETGTVKSQGGVLGGGAGITNHIKLFSPVQPRCVVLEYRAQGFQGAGQIDEPSVIVPGTPIRLHAY